MSVLGVARFGIVRWLVVRWVWLRSSFFACGGSRTWRFGLGHLVSVPGFALFDAAFPLSVLVFLCSGSWLSWQSVGRLGLPPVLGSLGSGPGSRRGCLASSCLGFRSVFGLAFRGLGVGVWFRSVRVGDLFVGLHLTAR